MKLITSISGHIIDIENKNIYNGIIKIENGKLKSIEKSEDVTDQYILPGFIDSHIHIESSMLTPSEFAKIAVTHGTIAAICDPHEIANVMGIEGVNFMIENGKTVPFNFFFGAPSCVPATQYESSGAKIDLTQIEELLQKDDIYLLSEMMNYFGVINNDNFEIEKTKLARKYNKPIDGHAPSINEEQAKKYANAGITTDHESSTIDEAINKFKFGIKTLIREGSAARNFEKLIPLIKSYPNQIMFCSDDKHPDDLLKGHINKMVSRAIGYGYDIFDILKVACINPINHYNTNTGKLNIGDIANFITIDKLTSDFKVTQTIIKGEIVAENGISKIESKKIETINNFNADFLKTEDIHFPATDKPIPTIQVFDGEIFTKKIFAKPKILDNCFISDTDSDLLKIVVYNRYYKSKPAVAFVKGFGLKKGSIASTVSHDSHNIIAVGVNDSDIINSINEIIRKKGGIIFSLDKTSKILELPIAGIMSDKNIYTVADSYEKLDLIAKEHGCILKAPFMTLSFLALLVIPEIKLSDKGLFNSSDFAFINY